MFRIETISVEVRKIPALTFVCFRRGWIGALSKKILEHFTAIFQMTSLYNKTGDSGKF